MNRLTRIHSAGLLLVFALLLGNPGCGCGGDFGLLSTPPPTPPPTPIVYVGNEDIPDVPNEVLVVDVNTMTINGTIPNAGGYRMVLTPDGSKLYSTGGGPTLYISDTTTNTLITAYDPAAFFAGTSMQLRAIAMNPAGTRVYVFDELDDADLFVIDTATDVPVASAFTGVSPFAQPENAFVDVTGGFLFMVDNFNIWKIDATALTVAGVVPSGGDAQGIALRPDGARVYFEGLTGGIDVVDTAGAMAFVTNIPDPGCGGFCGFYLEHAKAGSRIYGVDQGNNLGVYDSATNNFIANVALSTGNARGVTTTADGSTILVATDNGLIKIDAVTLLETGFLPGAFQSVVAAP